MLISKPATDSSKEDMTELAHKAGLDPRLQAEFFNNPSVKATVERAARIFWRWCGKSRRYAELSDLEQEIWLKLVRYIHLYRKEASFETWVSNITKNLAIDEQRRQKKQPNIIALNEHLSREEQSSTDTDRKALLRICINSLNESEKKLLECFLAGKTLVEIADEIGVSKSTAHSRLRVLRRKLKEAIDIRR